MTKMVLLVPKTNLKTYKKVLNLTSPTPPGNKKTSQEWSQQCQDSSHPQYWIRQRLTTSFWNRWVVNAGVSEDICLSKIMPGFGKALKSESASGVPHPFSDRKNNGKINGKGGNPLHPPITDHFRDSGFWSRPLIFSDALASLALAPMIVCLTHSSKLEIGNFACLTVISPSVSSSLNSSLV